MKLKVFLYLIGIVFAIYFLFWLLIPGATMIANNAATGISYTLGQLAVVVVIFWLGHRRKVHGTRHD